MEEKEGGRERIKCAYLEKEQQQKSSQVGSGDQRDVFTMAALTKPLVCLVSIPAGVFCAV